MAVGLGGIKLKIQTTCRNGQGWALQSYSCSRASTRVATPRIIQDTKPEIMMGLLNINLEECSISNIYDLFPLINIVWDALELKTMTNTTLSQTAPGITF